MQFVRTKLRTTARPEFDPSVWRNCSSGHSSRYQLASLLRQAVTLAIGVFGSAIFTASVPGFGAEPTALETLSQKAQPSTVYLDVEYPDPNIRGISHENGSGVIVSREGNVLTA